MKEVILNSFPDHRGDLPEVCKHYWQSRHQQTVDDDFIVYGCCLLIPSQMRHSILSQLHESHQGAVHTKQWTRLTVYWLDLNNDVDNIVSQYTHCQSHLPSHNKEPMTAKLRTISSAGFCYHVGQCYFVIVDCYTDWPNVVPMGETASTTNLIAILRELFARTAIPDMFWSNGGLQFASNQFYQFTREWKFRHQTSSPHYP